MNFLVDFWNQMETSSGPYVHPEDDLPARRIHEPIRSMSEYAEAFRADRLDDGKFHTTLLPKPYSGDLDNAEILILLLNPGLGPTDFKAECEYPEYRSEMMGTLRQTHKQHVCLDPKWAWTEGFAWWEQKFRRLAQEVAKRNPALSYFAALELIAHKVAWLELVPYHSRSFAGGFNLRSSEVAKDFVHSELKKRDRLIVVTRSVTAWGFAEGDSSSNLVLYPSRQARGASIGPGTPGGDAILRRIFGYK